MSKQVDENEEDVKENKMYTIDNWKQDFKDIDSRNDYYSYITKSIQQLIQTAKTDQAKNFYQGIIKQAKSMIKDTEQVFKESEYSTELESACDDFLTQISQVIMQEMVRISKSITNFMIDLQRVRREAHHIYAVLRAIPVLGKFLPPDPLKNAIEGSRLNVKFSNWCLNIQSNPKKIFTLKNKNDIINMLKEARNNNKRVRVINFKHTFSPQFVDDDQYLGLMIPEKFIDLNPQESNKFIKFNDSLTRAYVEESEFMYVDLHVPDPNKKDDKFWGITCGGGSSILLYTELVQERFRRELPFPSEIANVLQVYQGWTGTTANPCHGAGKNTTNTSTYVEEMTLILWNGEEKTFTNKNGLKDVCAHFGLLGIVIKLKIRMLPEYYCRLKQDNTPYRKIIPKKENQGLETPFTEIVRDNDYAQFFWLPRDSNLLCTTWKKVFRKDLKEKPQILLTEAVKAQNLMFFTILQFLFPYMPVRGHDANIFTLVISKFYAFGHSVLLPFQTPTAAIPSFSGVHIYWGLQNLRLSNFEWHFPLPGQTDSDGKVILNKNKEPAYPNCELARIVFGVGRTLFREWKKRNIFIQTQPLESRVYRANKGYNLMDGGNFDFVLSVELLIPPGSIERNKLAREYEQEFLTRCIKRYIDFDKVYYPKYGLRYVRPHWGKIWQNLKVYCPNKNENPNLETNKYVDIYTHLKFCYGDEIDNFNKIRKECDPYNMFINKGLGPIFGVDVNNNQPNYSKE